MMEYQTCSVFNCWRFLPCRFTDVDASTVDDPFWHNLEFRHDRPNTGITRIIVPGGSQRHVVGRNPSWMPHVLPEIFATPDPSAPQSTGLGGSFAIIIALLALTTRPRHMDDVFLQGQWNRHQWTGSRCPQAGKKKEKKPHQRVLWCATTNFQLSRPRPQGLSAGCDGTSLL